ncbi:MAG: type I methionyl aminopeptidase [Anaerovoracaceae bacterium]|jgi:methionyl aminopeptidase
MISIKGEYELQLMRQSGRVTGRILRDLKGLIRPGITTWDIDHYVDEAIRAQGMTPTFKGYQGYPASACTSVNDEIVHGIPSRRRVLQEGDIVSVDIGSTWHGYVSDAARTYAVGRIDEAARSLIESARRAFFCGLTECRPRHRVSDISHAIQESVEGDGCGVVRELVGHGVGSRMHEEPQIPNYGRPGRGPRIAKGMVFAIEPMITAGSPQIRQLDDGWTIVTADGSLAAHYENTVVITDDEPELLTLDTEEENS